MQLINIFYKNERLICQYSLASELSVEITLTISIVFVDIESINFQIYLWELNFDVGMTPKYINI